MTNLIPFPQMSAPVEPPPPVLLTVTDLKVHFPRPRNGLMAKPEVVRAVDGVNFEVRRGTTLAVVGESGSGKTTTALAVMRLAPITAGSVRLGLTDLSLLGDEAMRQARRRVQMIFQDPYSSLNPELVVCDEPVSALDIAIRAQILNLLARLQRELGLTYLFISHDMAVVEHICDEIAVMYLGQIVERAPRQAFFARPLHPYSAALMSAVPTVQGGRTRAAQRIRLVGDPPSPIDPPAGCRFAGRCPAAGPGCEAPQVLREMQPGHWVACHRVARVDGQPVGPLQMPVAA